MTRRSHQRKTTRRVYIVIPADTRRERCKGPTCHAPIYWVFIQSTGKRIPVDASAPNCVEPSNANELPQDGRGIAHHWLCKDREYWVERARRKRAEENR
jgi:hypothetical protein